MHSRIRMCFDKELPAEEKIEFLFGGFHIIR